MRINNSSLPSIPLAITCGREVIREFDFKNDSGERVQGKKTALQFTFQDSEGVPTVGVGVLKGVEIDFTPFAGMPLTVFVSLFTLDRSGVCLFNIVGADLPEKKKQ